MDVNWGKATTDWQERQQLDSKNHELKDCQPKDREWTTGGRVSLNWGQWNDG